MIKTRCFLSATLAIVLGLLPLSALALAPQWYMKMTAVVEDGETFFYDDRSGVFGRLSGAGNSEDKHDIPAFSDLSALPVAIVFDKSSRWWSKEQYLSSYTNPGKGRKTWDFTVYSSFPNGQITLVWDGLNVVSGGDGNFRTQLNQDDEVLDRLTLIDRETGQQIEARTGRTLNSYEFNMNGKTERKFRWVQNRVRAGDLRPLPIKPVDPGVTKAPNLERGTVRQRLPGDMLPAWQPGDILPSPEEAGALPVFPGTPALSEPAIRSPMVEKLEQD
ncbi:MAG: hypothetical protein HRU51_06315 [Xanthomonadales bacterium]|nr:hypothetical protein [Xanthomonadales bacterium]